MRGGCTCLRDEDCNIDQIPALCAGSCGGLGLRLCLADTDCQALPCQLTAKVCQWPQGRTCNADADCDPLPLCVNQMGRQFCVWSQTGMDTCTTNDDCLCVPGDPGQPNRCFGTGRPCNTGADCKLSCQNGGCLLGASCAPSEGLGCPDVRP